MRVSLLTDAPKHNLALMKISMWHKEAGDEASLNMPICKADYRYASILFERNKNSFFADEYGGPGVGSDCLNKEIEKQKPDYKLFGLDYSLGYTYRPCFNTCIFCKVPGMNHPDIEHHSIWEFHDTRFKKICLLNNNTFQDSMWKETFNESWDEGLSLIDENGYDLRLIDDEKAMALKKTMFIGKIHFAWDRMVDEGIVKNGLKILNKNKIRGSVYVLIGFNTTEEEDIHRCQIIKDNGQDPYIMPYNQSKREKRFKRFMDSFMWRKYKTINEAWGDYHG